MKTRNNVRTLTQLGLLLAIVLVMAYTPLGFLPIGPLSLSLLTIPVAIGAMVMGPAAGAFLGGAFGVTSFLNAMEGKSAMGAALFGISPVNCFIVCVGARILCGLVCGFLYKGVKKAMPRKEKLCCVLGGLSAPVGNTIFFMGALMLFYGSSSYVQDMAAGMGIANPLVFVLALVGIQGLVEAVVCCAVSAAVTVPLLRVLKGK